MKKIDTNSEEIDEKRFHHFMFILYKDSESYNYDDLLFDLKGSFKNYAYIEHLPEKDEKKAHTHFILSLDNARSIRSICSRLGIQPNYCQNIKSLRASCRYLIHADDQDKIQYNLSDVVVSHSFTRKYYGAFDDLKSEQDIIDDIYSFIESTKELPHNDHLRELVKFINEQAYDTIYKRYRYEFMDYLNSFEHKVNIISNKGK